MVSDREKKNADIIGLTGYPARRLSRCDPGHDPDAGPASTSIDSAPSTSSASSIAALCISDQNILFVAPSAAVPKSFVPLSAEVRLRSPLMRRIWIFV